MLFGDEQGGDVLAGEPAAAKPQAQAETPRSMSVAVKVQQQIALNQQKRLARLQVRSPAGFLAMARWSWEFRWCGLSLRGRLDCNMIATEVVRAACRFGSPGEASTAAD